MHVVLTCVDQHVWTWQLWPASELHAAASGAYNGPAAIVAACIEHGPVDACA